jgi:hypothetical protein
MLYQQVPERLIGEFLKILHAISRQEIERVPSLVIEFDVFAGHRDFLAFFRANAVDSAGASFTIKHTSRGFREIEQQARLGLTSFPVRSLVLEMWGKADELRLSVVMGLRKGLSLIRGMRRSLTEDEQHKIAGVIVEHLEQSNWKIEQGPSRVADDMVGLQQ